MNGKAAEHQTPLGSMWSTWTEHGLYRLDWTQPSGKIGQAYDFDGCLAEFYRGSASCFDDLSIDEGGWSPFNRRIYECCRTIPRGETVTYKELATMAGRETACRAAGAAMSRNRILLVIPCHRVIASDGSLRGFSAPGGLDTKRKLLDFESDTTGLRVAS